MFHRVQLNSSPQNLLQIRILFKFGHNSWQGNLWQPLHPFHSSKDMVLLPAGLSHRLSLWLFHSKPLSFLDHMTSGPNIQCGPQHRGLGRHHLKLGGGLHRTQMDIFSVRPGSNEKTGGPDVSQNWGWSGINSVSA